MVINNKKDAQKRFRFSSTPIFSKRKKAWTEVLEVFFAILLLTGVIAILLNTGGIVQDKKKSEGIYKEQEVVLKTIQLNDNLRKSILEAPVLIESTEPGFPVNVNDAINSIPNYLECTAKICTLKDPCELYTPLEKNEIYVKSVLITADIDEYDSRTLNLFCWEQD